MPLVFHLHGGGLVVGTMYDDVAAAAEVASPSVVRVASVRYRLAPEDPYPAALEDSYAALVWLVSNAADLGVDPDRVVVAGVVAGAGLAASTALLARERGGPAIAGQMLGLPDAGRPQRQPVRPADGRDGRVGPHRERTAWAAYLPGVAGARTCRRPPHRRGPTTSAACRRRTSTSARRRRSATRWWRTPTRSGARAGVRSCTSGRRVPRLRVPRPAGRALTRLPRGADALAAARAGVTAVSHGPHLIAYADRFGGDLSGLRALLDGPLAGAFDGVHLLPFFTPFDGTDAGFDPDDHTAVDPRLGGWDDVRALADDHVVMADVIVNHVSARSAAFLDVRERGDARRRRACSSRCRRCSRSRWKNDSARACPSSAG